MNLKVKDDSLEPLIQLENLRELSLSNQFKVEEYAKLFWHCHIRNVNFSDLTYI